MAGERIPRTVHAWLEKELPRWREDGLIGAEASRELERRYGLEGRSHVPAVVFIIYLVGSLLIGGGILSFVAWNWDRLPGAAKLALGGVALVAAYGLGFWFWKVDGRRPLLGHSLTLLGSLLFGANIGIVSQVFQLDGEFWQAAGLWGAGAAVAAWLFLSIPNGVLAALLGLFWCIPAIDEWDVVWPGFVPAVLLLPLAFRLVSVPLFLACVGAAAIPLAVEAGEFGDRAVCVVLSILASTSLLLALPYVLHDRWRSMGAVSTGVGVLAVIGLGYMLSFHELAGEMELGDPRDRRWLFGVLPQSVGVVVCVVLMLVRPSEVRRRGVAGVFGLAAAGGLLVGTLLPDPEVPLAILANLGLVLLGGYAITSSMRTLQRFRYWSGSMLLGLVIVSRFIEYETGLLAKAVVFTACGVAVIVAGLAFERRVTAQEARHAA